MSWTEVDVPVERLWTVFCAVRRRPRCNPRIWTARVRGGELEVGAGFPYSRRPVHIVPILPERETQMMLGDFRPRRSRALMDQGRW